jgi:sec-independent protein translocase protein TatA
VTTADLPAALGGRYSWSVVGDILQPTHLIFVLAIALLVLGPKRLPEVGRSLGKGLRDFKEAISGEEHPRPEEMEPAATVQVPPQPSAYAAPEPQPSAPVAPEPVVQVAPQPAAPVEAHPAAQPTPAPVGSAADDDRSS